MYFCELIIKVSIQRLSDLLSGVIELLDFEPIKMHISYNEFKNPKFYIQYDKDYILNNLSKSEVDGGITSFSLYDQSHTDENTNPFFRFSLSDATLNEELVKCNFKWIAYKKLDWLINDEFILKRLLQEDVELVYLITSNQHDVYAQTRAHESEKNSNFISKLLSKKNWGRREIVNGIAFIAAPLMYFGKAYDEVISIKYLQAYEKARKININSKEIIKIEIYPLYSNPKEYRNEQKDYWKMMNLSKKIEDYEKLKKRDFTEYLKRRSSLYDLKKKSSLYKKR